LKKQQSTKRHAFTSLYEIALINIGFCYDRCQILLGPILSGHVLLKNHHFLKLHLLELFRVLQNDGSQNIQTKPEIVALYSQVGVEEAQTNLHGELPEQKASDPFEVHVVKVYTLILEMQEQLGVNPSYHFLYPHKGFLDSWPGTCVVIQNAI